MADLKKIEGISSIYAQKLKNIDVNSIEKLLEKGGTAKGRKEIAEASGISEKLILEWVNRADLFRIHGVGEEYSDLLEACGVDTVAELAQRNAKNLHQKMLEVNGVKNLVRKQPSEEQVLYWIEEAKSLPKKVTY